MVLASEKLAVGNVYTRAQLREIFNTNDANINNGVFPLKGYQSVVLFITENKTPDRTQFIDKLDGDVLYWQGQALSRSDQRILNPQADGVELLVFYRLSRNQYPGAGFVFEGQFEYVTHQGSKPTDFTLRRVTCPDDQRGAELALAQVASAVNKGQGFAGNQATRKAIEQHAMAVAIQHFEGQGWTVDPSVAAT